jgi:hypothetical protein
LVTNDAKPTEPWIRTVSSAIVVASVALIAILASVAVPGPVGSRVPKPDATVDPGLFERVEVAALARGTAMTIKPQDPGARSAGNLDQGSTLPSQTCEPSRPAPVRPAQDASAGSVSKNVWRHDGDISWFGPGLYGGNGKACGQTLDQDAVVVTSIGRSRADPGHVPPLTATTPTVPVVDRGPLRRAAI